MIRAEEVLRGALPRAEADQELEHAWEHLDDIEADGEDIGTVSAGYSAAAALRVALRDELFDPEHLETTVADADVDPEMLDAGFAAASAHAGGPVGDPSSDTERRRSFWLWWLDVAVPQALSAAR